MLIKTFTKVIILIFILFFSLKTEADGTIIALVSSSKPDCSIFTNNFQPKTKLDSLLDLSYKDVSFSGKDYVYDYLEPIVKISPGNELNFSQDYDKTKLSRDLVKLTVNNQNWTELPPEIYDLTNLEYLNIDNNNFSKLDPRLSNLKKLKYLSVYNQGFYAYDPKDNYTFLKNGFNEFPNFIDQLPNLEYISFDKNIIDRIPDTITNLSNLKILKLNSNRISTLPEDFGNLKKLEVLEIQSNSLLSLPESFGDLENLKEFNFWGNEYRADYLNKVRIDPIANNFGNHDWSQGKKHWENIRAYIKIPKSFIKLQNLVYLNAGNANFLTFPKEFLELKNLEFLDMSFTFKDYYIDDKIPDKLGNLENLRYLSLTSAPNLPDTIQNLKYLEYLDLRYYSGKTISKNLEKLSNLKKINLLQADELKTKLEIGYLQNLEYINAYYSKIKSTKGLNCLTKLKLLEVDYGDLSKISNMTGLEELRINAEVINHNKLFDELEKMIWLKKLNLTDSSGRNQYDLGKAKNREYKFSRQKVESLVKKLDKTCIVLNTLDYRESRIVSPICNFEP